MTTWTVPATVVRVVDADTLECDLDLGWRITYRAKVRLAGVNAPEMSTPEGKAARAWVAEVLIAQVTVVSHSLDKYGRVLGEVRVGDWDLATALLEAGHAVPYVTA